VTTKFKMHETLENAFIAGLLLTGSVERAETAVLESVRMSCCDDLFSEALFRRTILYSLEPHSDSSIDQQREIDRAGPILPFELRCVLNLPRHLRYCYVLRILVGLSREVCSWLLHLDTSQIDQRTSAAILELPFIQQRTGRCSESSLVKNPINKESFSPRARRSGHKRKTLRRESPVTFFTSTRIIEFKQLENS
jgi:hypothetical protein